MEQSLLRSSVRKTNRFRYLTYFFVLLLLPTIGCSLFSNSSERAEVRIEALPSLTPTSMNNQAAAPPPPQQPPQAPSPPVSEESNLQEEEVVPPPAIDTLAPPTSTPVINPMTEANLCPSTAPSEIWTFTNLQWVGTEYELIMYGNIENNSDTPQEVSYVTGSFFDEQGTMIASEESVDQFIPFDIIPPGGDVAFELAVEGITSMADCSLRVESIAAEEMPRQDFEFSDIYEVDEGAGIYCIGGLLNNSGAPLTENLTISVVLYDEVDRIINFGDYMPELDNDSQTFTFEVCVDTFGQNIARHELQAWGQ